MSNNTKGKPYQGKNFNPNFKYNNKNKTSKDASNTNTNNQKGYGGGNSRKATQKHAPGNDRRSTSRNGTKHSTKRDTNNVPAIDLRSASHNSSNNDNSCLDTNGKFDPTTATDQNNELAMLDACERFLATTLKNAMVEKKLPEQIISAVDRQKQSDATDPTVVKFVRKFGEYTPDRIDQDKMFTVLRPSAPVDHDKLKEYNKNRKANHDAAQDELQQLHEKAETRRKDEYIKKHLEFDTTTNSYKISQTNLDAFVPVTFERETYTKIQSVKCDDTMLIEHEGLLVTVENRNLIPQELPLKFIQKDESEEAEAYKKSINKYNESLFAKELEHDQNTKLAFTTLFNLLSVNALKEIKKTVQFLHSTMSPDQWIGQSNFIELLNAFEATFHPLYLYTNNTTQSTIKLNNLITKIQSDNYFHRKPNESYSKVLNRFKDVYRWLTTAEYILEGQFIKITDHLYILKMLSALKPDPLHYTVYHYVNSRLNDKQTELCETVSEQLTEMLQTFSTQDDAINKAKLAQEKADAKTKASAFFNKNKGNTSKVTDDIDPSKKADILVADLLNLPLNPDQIAILQKKLDNKPKQPFPRSDQKPKDNKETKGPPFKKAKPNNGTFSTRPVEFDVDDAEFSGEFYTADSSFVLANATSNGHRTNDLPLPISEGFLTLDNGNSFRHIIPKSATSILVETYNVRNAPSLNGLGNDWTNTMQRGGIHPLVGHVSISNDSMTEVFLINEALLEHDGWLKEEYSDVHGCFVKRYSRSFSNGFNYILEFVLYPCGHYLARDPATATNFEGPLLDEIKDSGRLGPYKEKLAYLHANRWKNYLRDGRQ